MEWARCRVKIGIDAKVFDELAVGFMLSVLRRDFSGHARAVTPRESFGKPLQWA